MEKDTKMTFRDFWKSIFYSWDIYVALLVVISLLFILPSQVPFTATKEIFTVSISVLSIIFSIFFAALAILITAGDNEFVQFLQEHNDYQKIIWTFRMTLLLLFTALIVSIGFFVAGNMYDSQAFFVYFPKWSIVLFGFCVTYALFASLSSTMDAIKYAELRARYIKITKQKENQ
jgi:ABC-type uncharacterized transport system fused permease/ATPase subunit